MCWENHLNVSTNNVSKGEVTIMPKGSRVDKVYQALKRQGMSSGKAARIAQSKTHQSLKTGNRPKGK